MDPVTGVITYTNTSTTAVADQFSYTIANQAGLVSAPATVTVQIVAACDPLTGSCPDRPGGAGARAGDPDRARGQPGGLVRAARHRGAAG